MYNRSTLLLLVIVLLSGLLASSVYGQERIPSHRIGMIPTDVLSEEVKESAMQAAREKKEAGSGGAMSKIGMELTVLYHQYQAEGAAGIRSIRSEVIRRGQTDKKKRGQRLTHSPISPNGRFVTVDAVAVDGGTDLQNSLNRLGLRNGAKTGDLVSGRLPISALKEAARLESLRGMMPSRAHISAGSVGSEADTAHRAVEVRENRGIDGEGQKVCALSDSYDRSGAAVTSASDDIETGDLPARANIDVLDDGLSPSEATDEGRAMLQLIHDIAPGAGLGFHTAFGGLANFATGIQELADAGCTVIVDDVRYFAQPFYQDGPVSNAVEDVVSQGVPYFSSAGNDGQNSYEAPFRDSEEAGVISNTSDAHDFNEGTTTDTRQEITVNTGGRFEITSFQWTDPSAFVEGSGGPDTDLNLALVNDTMGVVASSADDSQSRGFPFESLEFENDGTVDTDEDGVPDSTFHLVIEKADGPDPDEVKYIYAGENFEIEEYDTLGPTIYGHPNADEAIATAAAPYFNTPPFSDALDSGAALEPFSSKGGIDIRFDQSGEELNTPESRQKPDVTGTDGVQTTFFRPVPGENIFRFFGTSAAAPNIAAIAGLILESRPDLNPSEVYGRLESNAEDVSIRLNRQSEFVSISEGVDPWSGHGFVRADQAVPEPTQARIVNFSASGSESLSKGGTVELNWQKVGPGQVDEYVLRQQFYDGEFNERERISGGGASEFTATIEDLPVGDHTFQIEAIRNGEVLAVNTTSTTVRRDDAEVVAYPNPFSRSVNLSVTLPEGTSEVLQIEVYDVLGRLVGVDERTVDGSRSIFLGSEQIGIRGNGVYFVRVEGENFTETVQVSRVR